MKTFQVSLNILLLLLSPVVFSDILAKQSWIAAPPPGSQVLAAYMVLENTSEQNRILASVSSDQFNEIQIHSSEMNDGMMTMNHLSSITVPAMSSVELSSGGLHMMLMGPKKYFKAGDTVALDLSFEDGTTLTVPVPVRTR